jgi:GDP-D-mannose dehydratase
LAKTGATLVGNPQKLMHMTGWKPSVDFHEMIKLLLLQEGMRVEG